MYMADSLDTAVGSDLTELEDAFQAGGDAALTALVKEQVRQTPQGPMYYLLEDPLGQSLPVIFRLFTAEKAGSI
jgi:hypothetical protein